MRLFWGRLIVDDEDRFVLNRVQSWFVRLVFENLNGVAEKKIFLSSLLQILLLRCDCLGL